MSDNSKSGMNQSMIQFWQGLAFNIVQYWNAFETETHSRYRWPKFASNPKSAIFGSISIKIFNYFFSKSQLIAFDYIT